ncbi:hypothetical protein Tco_0006267 [Tanacetum coccineum]
MNQNYFEPNPSYFSFDQPSQYPIDQSPPQEMSIQDMEDLKQQYLDEMKNMINQIHIKDYRNERIDICYRRECENGMSIKINKKKELRQLEEATNESSISITPDFPITNSLIMEDELLDTISEKESDEENESSVEDLNLTLSESEDLSEDLSNIEKSLLNRDTSIVFSPKFDSLLDEFSGELAHINLISPEIDEADFDPEDEIHAVIKSLSPSPIPVEDSNSLMEEIDIFLAPDDSIPSGIENDDYDSEGDILFLEELLSNDSLSLPENESFHFDHFYDPSPLRSLRNHQEMIGIHFVIEPDTGILLLNNSFISRIIAYNEDKSPPSLPVFIGALKLSRISPDYEDSRARDFVLCSLELQSLA